MQYTPKTWHIAVAVFALGVITASVTVLVVTIGGRSGSQSADAAADGTLEAVDVSGEADEAVSARDLQVPNAAAEVRSWGWQRFRPPKSQWSASEVDEHWIDPESIGTEYLSEENDQLIEELLQSVP
jgi:hypothetical protein